MKAAAAMDVFSNVTHGFAALLIGNCFEDVIVTTVNVSQRSFALDRRVPNPDTSSTSYKDHVKEPPEVVPSALDLKTGGSYANVWIVTFVTTTLLATFVCACAGVKYLSSGYYSNAYAHISSEDKRDSRVMCVDGAALDTPQQSPVFSKENRMFSPRGGAAGGNRNAAPRMSAREKRAALNARSIPTFHRTNRDAMEDFEVLSSASEFSSSGDMERPWQSRNPMFSAPVGASRGHVPRLSGLDFGQTMDEDQEGDVAAQFWRPGNRGRDDDR